MEVLIKIGGQAVYVEVTVEVYKCRDSAEHKNENIIHEKRSIGTDGSNGLVVWTSPTIFLLPFYLFQVFPPRYTQCRLSLPLPAHKHFLNQRKGVYLTDS